MTHNPTNPRRTIFKGHRSIEHKIQVILLHLHDQISKKIRATLIKIQIVLELMKRKTTWPQIWPDLIVKSNKKSLLQTLLKNLTQTHPPIQHILHDRRNRGTSTHSRKKSSQKAIKLEKSTLRCLPPSKTKKILLKDLFLKWQECYKKWQIGIECRVEEVKFEIIVLLFLVLRAGSRLRLMW